MSRAWEQRRKGKILIKEGIQKWLRDFLQTTFGSACGQDALDVFGQQIEFEIYQIAGF